MDALTLILIAVGIVAVGGLGALGFIEYKKNAARSRVAESGHPSGPPVESTPALREVAQKEPAGARAAASLESVVEKPAAVSRPVSSEPTPEQRAVLAKLTVMSEWFNREIAAVVADCPVAEIEGLIEAGLLVADEGGARFNLPAAARGSAAASLAPDEARAARLRHADYFTGLGEEAIAANAATTAKAPGGVNAPPVIFFEEERGHFEAAFSFLSGTSGLAAELFRLVDAVGWGHAIQLSPPDLVKWAETGLAAARTMNDRVAERDALDRLAGAHTDAGAHAEALSCYEQAAAVSRELEDRFGEGRAIGNTGLARHRMGDAAGAVAAYEEVIAIMRELGDRPREGIALASLGQAAADMGDHAKAIDHFEQFLQLTIETGDRRSTAMALAHLGIVYAKTGDDAKAAEYHERELQIAQQLRDLHAEAHALGAFGGLCRKRGNIDRAMQCFTRQLEVAHLLHDAISGARAMGELGLCHLAGDHASRALECFEEQLKISRKIRDREGEAHALWNAARVVHSRGQSADAITRASAALPIFDEIKSPEAAKLRSEIATWRAEGT